MRKYKYNFKIIFSTILLFLVLIVIDKDNYAMGINHYLQNDWYKEDIIGVKKANITSITFIEEEEDVDINSYEKVWKLDDTGLMAYFTTDTDIVISIPNDDYLMADKNANNLFSFYNVVYVDSDGEEHYLDIDENIDKTIKSSLQKIENLYLLDTSNVEDMSYMFCNLKNIEELDLTNFNTSKVNNMSYMFSGMKKLKNINLESFNTQNVTNMSGMFKDLFNIKNLDIKNFDTANVKNMYEMFEGMIKIQNLDISNFDTSNVINIGEIFFGCKKLKNLKIDSLNLINAYESVSGMFSNCDNLEYIDFTNVELPYSLDSMFKGISAKNMTISNIRTDKVNNMHSLFKDSKNLINLTATLNTENVEDMSFMFSNCYKLVSINISNMNTKKVNNMSYMFHNCKSLKEIDTKNYDTSNVYDMTGMFSNCRDLKKLDLSNFDTRNVKPNRLYEMLLNLVGLCELDISNNNFVLNYVDEYYSKNDVDYFSYYNLSLGDLWNLKKIKINNEIANRAYDLLLIGNWRNVKTNNISFISKDKNVLNRFTSGEYELIPSYKISFDTRNILNMYDMNFPKGDSLNTEADILKIDEDNNVYYREGYDFFGWYLDNNYQNRLPKSLKIDNDTILYAKIEIKKFNIIFNTNGGSEVPSQIVEYNKTASLPTIIPKKKNYKFVGWYKDNEFVELFDFDTKIKEDTEIYAKYEFTYSY